MAYQHRSSLEFTQDRMYRIHRPFRRALAIITALCVAVTTTAWAESETYDLSGFDGVSVAEGIHVHVTIGDAFEVVAQSDDIRQLELLDLDVAHGTLRASMRNRPFTRDLEEAPRVTIEVTMPSLLRVAASTGAELVADIMSGSVLEVSSSTGAMLGIDELAGGTLSMGASTGGSVRITRGNCTSLSAELSGGASLEMDGVECVDAAITASSGSQGAIATVRSPLAMLRCGSSLRTFAASAKSIDGTAVDRYHALQRNSAVYGAKSISGSTRKH